jgi:Rieske Fe-S protein
VGAARLRPAEAAERLERLRGLDGVGRTLAGAQGELVTSSGHRCVRCPWHGSTFRISDGSVRRGPATARQPAFETKVSDGGIVQVRPRS